MSPNIQLKRHRRFSAAEEGSTSIALLFIFLIVLGLISFAVAQSIRERRSETNIFNKETEKWQARSAINTLGQIVKIKLPRVYIADLGTARSLSEGRRLPSFDPEATVESKPLTVIDSDGNVVRSSYRIDECTSLLGKTDVWASGRIKTLESDAYSRGYTAQSLNIVTLAEISRQYSGGDEPAYLFTYILDAKIGNYRTRSSGELLLGPNDVNCGASVTLEIQPLTVERGNSITMTATYVNVSQLIFTNGAGAIIHQADVAQSNAPQTYTFNYAPAATDTYRVEGRSSSACYSRTPPIRVEVTEPRSSCPTVVNFSASALEINSGESVTLFWTVSDAAQVIFEGVPVSLNGSQSFTLTSDRIFTLIARDAGNTCPVQRQITVRVRPAPPCPLTAPSINALSANPNSLEPNQSSQITWNVSGMESGGQITLTGPNGFSQTGLPAGGSLNITPPAAEGDYVYTLTAENICPDGTRLTRQQQVVIQVRVCPTPTINSFVVNPTTVTAGGNQLIRFSWNVSGNPGAVSINNGVGGNLPPSGTVDVLQPNVTTTYTLTAFGCGQTKTASMTVVVNTCPAPTINSFTVAPNTVTIGGNSAVQFFWNVSDTSGTNVALQIVDVNSNSVIYTTSDLTGNWSMLQPQVTTSYRLDVTNSCPSNVNSQTQITAMSPPGPCPVPPNPNSPLYILDYSAFGTNVCRPNTGCEILTAGFYLEGEYFADGRLRYRLAGTGELVRGNLSPTGRFLEITSSQLGSLRFGGLELYVNRNVFPSRFNGASDTANTAAALASPGLYNNTTVTLSRGGTLLKNYPAKVCSGGDESGFACTGITDVRVTDEINIGPGFDFSNDTLGYGPGQIIVPGRNGDQARIIINRQAGGWSCP